MTFDLVDLFEGMGYHAKLYKTKFPCQFLTKLKVICLPEIVIRADLNRFKNLSFNL